MAPHGSKGCRLYSTARSDCVFAALPPEAHSFFLRFLLSYPLFKILWMFLISYIKFLYNQFLFILLFFSPAFQDFITFDYIIICFLFFLYRFFCLLRFYWGFFFSFLFVSQQVICIPWGEYKFISFTSQAPAAASSLSHPLVHLHPLSFCAPWHASQGGSPN